MQTLNMAQSGSALVMRGRAWVPQHLGLFAPGPARRVDAKVGAAMLQRVLIRMLWGSTASWACKRGHRFLCPTRC